MQQTQAEHDREKKKKGADSKKEQEQRPCAVKHTGDTRGFAEQTRLRECEVFGNAEGAQRPNAAQ